MPFTMYWFNTWLCYHILTPLSYALFNIISHTYTLQSNLRCTRPIYFIIIILFADQWHIVYRTFIFTLKAINMIFTSKYYKRLVCRCITLSVKSVFVQLKIKPNGKASQYGFRHYIKIVNIVVLMALIKLIYLEIFLAES